MGIMPHNKRLQQERQFRRRKVYRGEIHPLRLTFKSLEEQVEIENISVKGLCVLVPKNTKRPLDFPLNETVHIKACLTPDARSPLVTYRIVYHHDFERQDRPYHRLGLERLGEIPTTQERRSQARYPSPNYIKTMAIFEHPFFPMRQVYGDICTFSSKGLCLKTSLRNGDLLSGQKVRLRLIFPLLGTVSCYASLRGVNLQPSHNRIYLNMEILSNLTAYQEKAGETLLMSPQAPSLRQLRADGFRMTSASTAISYEYRVDQFDMREIALLRMRSLHFQKELLELHSPEAFIDSYDQYSRHILARLNHKIIASTRLIFNNGDPEKVEHLKYGVKIPKWLWEEGFVECGRLVTDPDYRGADLFLNMTRFIGKTVLESGYRYMISSCTQSLEPIYARTGCKKIGTFTLGDDPKPWCLIVMDFEGTSKGIGVNPISWNIIQRPMVEFLVERNRLQLSPLNRLVLGFYKLFSPLAQWLLRRKA